MMRYRSDIEKGLIKVKNINNDLPVGGMIKETSCEKLAKLLAELRKPDADKFKTIVVDTVGALQDDYKAYLEMKKKGVLRTFNFSQNTLQKIRERKEFTE